MAEERLSILEQRRIEAAVIKPIYDEMKARLGTETAQQILGDAIVKAAVAAGREFAAEFDGQTDLMKFQEIFKHWLKGGALEVDYLERDEKAFSFNVTRCRYAEMYKDMGIGEIGHLLSCNRDGTFCKGFDPRIKFARGQTLMGGASHCDFRYSFEPEGAGEPAVES